MTITREWLLAIGPGDVTVTGQSFLLISVTGVGILLLCYRVYASSEGSGHGTNGNKMEPEVVKEKTERWSEDAEINPAFPPGEGPKNTIHPSSQNRSSPEQCGNSPGDGNPSLSTPNTANQGQDLPDMEFAWQTETDVSFDDIGGMDDLKDRLRAEVIKPIENPEKAEELGVAAPNIVFHGPPGTGKTFTAEALATELGLPFAKLSGADVQSKWINESASTVNNLFSEAKEMAAHEGGAVVFLDELDSVLKTRSGRGSSHEEDNKVVNEFLNNLEDTKAHGIVFIGATNRLEALDDAGTRSGRIDLKIKVGKPDTEAREAILRAQLDARKHNIPDEGITELARATDGAVAADLELIVNRAAKNVLGRDGDVIQWTDIVNSKCYP
jgi:SpoVK/Ycf46/Vps4 family AAA+-type ATPase